MNLPDGKYAAIAADPAWRFSTWSGSGRDRCPDARPFKGSPAKHYDVMSLDEIKALPVADAAAKDCALFLWVTNPMLPEGLEVMSAWGFTFKSVAFTWVKTTKRSDPCWVPKWHMGLGYWTRANTEMCLLGVRGKPKRISKGVRQLIVSPLREHSRKPDEFYRSVSDLVEGPYLEMFARQQREGWTSWGNETEKFTEFVA